MPLATKVTGSRIRPSRLRFARAASGGGTITFPTSPLDVRVEIALGADPAADPATWSWLDITQWVRYDPGIQITYGRRDESTRVEASTCRLTLDNRDGRWVRRNPYGAYYGQLSKNTPIRIGANPGDGQHYRYFGFVNEWPTRWSDKSGTDSTVSIACAGVLRRLQQAQNLRSALNGSIAGVAAGDYIPTAYWPMEDGAASTQFASQVVGIPPMQMNGPVTPGADSSLVGSGALANFASGGLAVGSLPYASTSQWFMTMAMRVDAAVTGGGIFAEISVSGSAIPKWTLEFEDVVAPTNDNIVVRGYDASGSLVVSLLALIVGATDLPDSNYFYNRWFLYSFGVRDQGVGTAVVYYGSAENDRVIFNANQLVSASAGHPTMIKIFGQTTPIGFGHVAFYTSSVVDLATDLQANAGAMAGWAGEMAHTRMIRLCREAGQDFTCTSATSALMGPQERGTLLDNLRACEASDGGVLYEHEFGLGYQSLDDRTNAQVQFALDFDRRHVADTPEPADDDQRLVNSYTAGRSGGSSATISDPDSIAREGIFAGSGTFSLYTDDQTLDVGGWKVHLGIVDEDRWPAIPIALHTTPDLIDAWTSLPYGARMTLANPPAEMAPDTVGAVIEGWTESIWPHRWEAVLNTTPASPYDVGKLAADSGDTDPFLGWLESDSCVLAADVDSTATSWQITADPVWTNTADDFPCDVRIGGEVVTVTACSGTSAPQTWTVIRSVNGVVKAHTAAAAEPIELVHPIILVP